MGVISYRDRNICGSLHSIGHGCVEFAAEWRKQDATNSLDLCQVFQRFAIVCCRVIQVFDKAKVVAMF